MPKSRKKKRPPKRVLALPDLEQSKTAVLNSLTSKSGQRTYDRAITDFVDWYCSEPRLTFNRSAVLRYRIFINSYRLVPRSRTSQKPYLANDAGAALLISNVARAQMEPEDWPASPARSTVTFPRPFEESRRLSNV
jgi:hypothetical protein